MATRKGNREMLQDDDLSEKMENAIDEAELALMQSEPLNTELRTHIRPSTARRLAQYCREHRSSSSVVVEVALAAFLYDQGY